MEQASPAEIFISQSKPRALKLAQELQKFLRLVVHGAVPWVSKGGIESGAKYPQELDNKLSSCIAGLVCVTPENQREPWILFEAGALSQRDHERVWVVLLGLKNDDIKWPLGQFQNTVVTDAEQMLAMVKSIRRIVSGATGQPWQSEEDLNVLFGKFWPDLRTTVDELVANPPETLEPTPSDLLQEVLQELRGRAVDSLRIVKTQLLLSELFRQVTHTPAPGIKELSQLPNVPPEANDVLSIVRIPSGSVQLVVPAIQSTVQLHPPSISMEPPPPKDSGG